MPHDLEEHYKSHAISPIAGRYADEVSEINPLFSEFALMKQRLKIEIEWFKALAAEEGVTAIDALSHEEIAFLDQILENFSDEDFDAIRKYERTFHHDVKAVEYFLRDKFKASELKDLFKKREFIHFAATSDDINNMAYACMLKELKEKVLLPYMDGVIASILLQADATKSLPMLSKTHGQAATPTTLGKEWANFAVRLKSSREKLAAIENHGKMNGL